MKVGTDGVLLGAWAEGGGQRVLDVGTGTGLIALMMAQRFPEARVVGIDIDDEACQQARENVAASPFADRVEIVKRAFSHEGGVFDMIVSNPPFFEMNNVTDDCYLKEAMFEEDLSLNELFEALRRFMKANGEAYIIYQADRFPELYDMCKTHKLKIMKMRFVHDISSKHALRVLLKLKIGPMSKLKVLQPLLIDRGNFIEMF